MMATSADDVYNFIREKGPVLPTAVAEKFSMNTLFASAFLSELSSKGKIMVSSIKVGGSPLYYLPEQKERLAEYKDNLHEKEQRTFEMLRSRMVVEDIRLDLLDRVALRKMKDYAIALNVTIGFQTRLFWKFFTVSDDMASQVISRMLQEEAASQSKEKEEEKVDVPEAQPAPEAKEVTHEREEGLAQQIASEKASFPGQKAPERKTDEPTRQPIRAEPQLRPLIEKTQAPVTKTFRPEATRAQTVTKQRPHAIEPYRIEPQDIDYYSLLEADMLGKMVAEYFKKRDIVLIFTEIQKKSSDIMGIMSVPSAIGDLEYFYYAKKKKSVTDKDIKEAYAESLILGYPLLYIAVGKLSKNAITFSDSKLKGCKIIELNA